MTYVPSKEDLIWTKNHIKNKRMWAVPSVGCVLIFDHNNVFFDTWMKSEPSDEETIRYQSIESNLLALGYSERKVSIMRGAHNVEDVMFALNTSIIKMEKNGTADDEWLSVKKSIEQHLKGSNKWKDPRLKGDDTKPRKSFNIKRNSRDLTLDD